MIEVEINQSVYMYVPLCVNCIDSLTKLCCKFGECHIDISQFVKVVIVTYHSIKPYYQSKIKKCVENPKHLHHLSSCPTSWPNVIKNIKKIFVAACELSLNKVLVVVFYQTEGNLISRFVTGNTRFTSFVLHMLSKEHNSCIILPKLTGWS